MLRTRHTAAVGLRVCVFVLCVRVFVALVYHLFWTPACPFFSEYPLCVGASAGVGDTQERGQHSSSFFLL